MKLTENQKRAYLMTGGTLLPAFVGVIAVASKQGQFKINGSTLLLFATLSVLGGFFTSQIIEKQ